MVCAHAQAQAHRRQRARLRTLAGQRHDGRTAGRSDRERHLSYFASEKIASIRTVDELAARCGCIFRSLDAANLYLPGVGLDGIGSATWSYSLLCRTIMSHTRGTAQLDFEVTGHKLNHFDIVKHLAPRDPASFPPDTWRDHFRDLAFNTPDGQPCPIPS